MYISSNVLQEPQPDQLAQVGPVGAHVYSYDNCADLM